MLENFSSKIQKSLDGIVRQNKVTAEDVKVAIKEIRLTLLEADVNYKVAKEFCKTIEEKAINDQVLKGLNPSQQVYKIVKDEMEALMSGDNELHLKGNDVILMVGLQGSGKTTSTGKISAYLRKKTKKNPLLVACDVYRPAAIDQLITIGKQLSIDVYHEDHKDVKQIAHNGIKHAREHGHDLVILDTAGRMHIDEELMKELEMLQTSFHPSETLLVLDGTVGQMAVDVATQFSEYVKISGLVFTKMDGDTRGGAILSVKQTTGIDIKFLGTSEKMDGLEQFDATRVVSRILGQGDLMGLIEKAEEFASNEDMEADAQKMMDGKFDFNDYLKQIKMVKKMGGIKSLLGMLPGANKFDMGMIDDKEFVRIQAMIESMTPEERKKPAIIAASRKKRIAAGSGTSVQQVNKLIKGYEQAKKMMKQMKGMDPTQMMKMFK
ncbi:MAG: signal recognition particle protein [Mycoplasmatales bacterium]